MTTASYPYVAKSSTCKYAASSGIVKTVGYTNVASNSPTALMTAVA